MPAQPQAGGGRGAPGVYQWSNLNGPGPRASVNCELLKLDSELKLKGASLPVPLLHCLTAASVPLALAVTGSHGGSCRNSESPARWTRPGTQGTRDCQWCTTAAADSESWSRGSSESMSSKFTRT